ncbi:guanine nucleotide-binding protein G(I)/G(S)/G(O) subunit gamma-4 isoform X1 [Mixophyes fleayi]|uniref:guanine nucleotide-binding protein G(I)/G(S)/G(O) subunit gamma-4 isoform X1 n=2 Tax=Mixophyes fleayi TaxID=3061075 RepID=UPI003F4E3411
MKRITFWSTVIQACILYNPHRRKSDLNLQMYGGCGGDQNLFKGLETRLPVILKTYQEGLQFAHTMKEIMSNNSTTSISQARKAVEQLKMEACMDRIKISKAAADLMAYCDAHTREDPLILPVPASENPFREKKFFCTIL